MRSIFPSCRNRVCQQRIVLREGRVLFIVVWTHLCVTVKNLDVMCVRSRFRRILFVLKEVLYDYYINQQGRIIIFYMIT